MPGTAPIAESDLTEPEVCQALLLQLAVSHTNDLAVVRAAHQGSFRLSFNCLVRDLVGQRLPDMLHRLVDNDTAPFATVVCGITGRRWAREFSPGLLPQPCSHGGPAPGARR
jgi:hypothetical protein